jgi:hypothetical protein
MRWKGRLIGNCAASSGHGAESVRPDVSFAEKQDDCKTDGLCANTYAFKGPGANCRRRDIGRQAVESVPFVSSEPLLQLRAGQVDVDQAALARADDGGAVDLPFLQPLRDTRPADTPRASANSDFRTTGKG